MKIIGAVLLAFLLTVSLAAQSEPNSRGTTQDSSSQATATGGESAVATQDQNATAVEPMAQTPTYRVTVVGRTTKAVNYQHHQGSTKVDLRGTSLMPEAKGDASVDSKNGRLQIDAKMEHLQRPGNFGPEYLTYVLWAITPEGRANNLGEVIPDNDGKASLKVTTNLQTFGLIVTAEPYFAVTQPSDLMVMENIIRSNTKGWELPIDAKFEAVQRGQYTVTIPASQLPATSSDTRKTPLELLEARNAVAIAKATGAEKYAPDSLAKAADFLNRGEDYLRRKQGSKAIGTVARGATEAAEDARLLTIRKKEEERIAEQQRLARERTEQAQAKAAQETAQRQQAEQERQAAEQAKLEAQQAQQQAEQQRQAAEAARQAALAQQQAAQADAQRAQLVAQQAQQQKEEMRTRLLNQLNQVLQTRDTARGVIATMPDVLFDFNKYTLRPEARERLAKVAGIILAYPDLHVQIEGHTDSIGSGAYNQTLSEQRAASVRDYLSSQGVAINNLVAQGFGKSDPVASNATPAGRQRNRRVDLVVSGAAIGQNVGGGVNSNTPPPAANNQVQPSTAPSNTMPAAATSPGQAPNNGASQTPNTSLSPPH